MYKNINQFRKHIRIDGPPKRGQYVLYWMQINRRFEYNYALDYAVAWANKLKQPLVILEGVASDYPWATARTTMFLLEGMAEHAGLMRERKELCYFPFPESKSGEYEFVVKRLCEKASLLISDEYPVFIMRQRNLRFQSLLSLPFHTVDSSGIIPMKLTEKDPYSAFIFRKLMQKKMRECLSSPPEENPLKGLGSYGDVTLEEELSTMREKGFAILQSKERMKEYLLGLRRVVQRIEAVETPGTRAAALDRMHEFVQEDLLWYDDDRNHPDKDRTSRLSPWLHTGKISSYEIVKQVLAVQPDGWQLDQVRPVEGKRAGFWGGHAAVGSFLDELITWRETGFHFAYHRHDYDRYSSLPSWALETLNEHATDPRAYIYSLQEFEEAKTHDPVWNAAQRQLREEGRIHGYLRMLWGKKILEWTPDPETALSVMIELNNLYALDGRDPNSYSGIFWTLGRFDRAWGPERPVFGKVRYMSSESARKKTSLEKYLKHYEE
ncbi:FAD-binding domain-containing protein [Balneolaceae bacterium ANBcel3]|nr:FAD-binding domain-containing protein [Balneolaceae bacterium ANBcel3]